MGRKLGWIRVGHTEIGGRVGVILRITRRVMNDRTMMSGRM
jgi:hypothetical protein